MLDEYDYCVRSGVAILVSMITSGLYANLSPVRLHTLPSVPWPFS